MILKKKCDDIFKIFDETINIFGNIWKSFLSILSKHFFDKSYTMLIKLDYPI